MGKVESLELIKSTWDDTKIPLGRKASVISEEFYSAGLDFATTAAYIRATPAEFDALLEIGALDDEVLERVSAVNPPKAAWTMLSNATDEEVCQALSAIERSRGASSEPRSSITELVYFSMIEVAEPTSEQRAALISSNALWHAVTKAEHFDSALNSWETNFMKDVAGKKKRGNTLTEKQGANIAKICAKLAKRGIISRESIDGDQELCDEILDALGL